MCLSSMCKSWKSLCDYFCSISVSSPGCIWGLEISLYPFPLGHPFLLMPNFQKTKILASSPITSWEIDGETVETVSEFIFWGSKITADGNWSHEIKRRLHLGRKVMTNLDSILKSRNITLPTKVHLVKAIGFSSGHVWMWELVYKESWALKNCSFWTVVLE